MNKISIKLLSAALAKSPTLRKVFTSGITIVIYALIQHKLINERKLENVTVNWDKSTIYLGDNFINEIVGRSLSNYVLGRARTKLNIRLRSLENDDFMTKHKTLSDS